MKRVVIFFAVLLLLSLNWFVDPADAAITQVLLKSPADSIKMTIANPTFKWGKIGVPREQVVKYHIALDTVLTQGYQFPSPLWEDSSYETRAESVVYAGPALVQWETYYWSVRVQVDSTKADGTHDTLWYKFVRPRIFFYTTATLMEIPDSLPTIQQGVVWAAGGDTVLVKSGVYYENLRFNKKGVILASYFARDGNIATVKSTIIDGGRLTRGEEKGSVICFTSKADSNSKVIGFTIRNGQGTKSADKVNGGGIFCEPGSTPTIAYNLITQNHAPDDGGGIFCNSAAPNIFDNLITENSAGGSGGGIQCYLSIRTKAGLGTSPPGGEENEERETEAIGRRTLSFPWEAEKTSPTTESNSEKAEDDLKNSLYPRDATEVSSALSSGPLAKPAQNNPPQVILDYFIRRDGIVEREKVLVGDTIVLDARESTDPDSGDSMFLYQYKALRWTRCETPDDWKTWPIPGGTGRYLDTVGIPVTEGMGGRYKLWLIAFDTHMAPDTSETVYVNIQRAPTADAGDTVGIAPGDTAWLDGSGSCDINPVDSILSYRWTQISGPILSIDTTVTPPETAFVWVTLSDSEAVNPYFETKDSSYYLGEYQFQLQVCDFDEDTIADCDMDIALVICSNRPVAMCPESLWGYEVSDTITLDGSESYDPDSALGDYVGSFTWRGLSRTTCEGALSFGLVINTTEAITSFVPEKGGVHAFALSVKDRYGTISGNEDTILISVQLRPTADAGPDTIVIPKTRAYLHGSACEVNWDQAESLSYEWQQDLSGGADVLPLSPSPDSQDVRCTPANGVYRFSLRVTDPYGASSRPDDTVRIIVNQLPTIGDYTPDPGDTAFAEGDTVELEVTAEDDPDDVEIYGDILTFTWTPVNWPNFPDNTYKPNLIGATEPTMKFVPLKHGEYELELVVHDTISPNQDPSMVPGFNIDTIKVRVDTTFAYPIIMGNLISSNTAGSKGGGIDCFRSSPEIINNIFYDNMSNSSGGAICSRNASTPQIRNSIFFGNVSRDSTGGAIANLEPQLSSAASIGFKPNTVVNNNDFWNNPGGDFYNPPAHSFDNVYAYPRLVDPEYGDFRLECSSPCRGAGEDSSDIGSLKHFQPCFNIDTLRMVSLSLFQNPVATAVAHFLVNTDVPLKAPPAAYVIIGEQAPIPVYFTNIFSTTYRGNFTFVSSGTAHISVFASSVLEQDTSIARDFAVQLIEAGRTGTLASHDDRLRVWFPQGVSKGEVYATCLPVPDDPQYNLEAKEAVGQAYQLGPLSDFKKELTISFPLDRYDLTEKDKTLFSICKYEGNGWEKQVSFLDENSVCTRVKKLGVYRLVYDANQEHITGIPRTYQLFQNYPNPFNPQTMIRYDLPDPGHVNITVYNILGQKVRSLVDGHQEPGHKSVNWDGKDSEGREVASGIYFYKIKARRFEKTKKMVLLK